jgi:hypothetical protein
MSEMRNRPTCLAFGRMKAPIIICATYWYIYQLSSWFAGWACFCILLLLLLFFSGGIRSSGIWRHHMLSRNVKNFIFRGFKITLLPHVEDWNIQAFFFGISPLEMKTLHCSEASITKYLGTQSYIPGISPAHRCGNLRSRIFYSYVLVQVTELKLLRINPLVSWTVTNLRLWSEQVVTWQNVN